MPVFLELFWLFLQCAYFIFLLVKIFKVKDQVRFFMRSRCGRIVGIDIWIKKNWKDSMPFLVRV